MFCKHPLDISFFHINTPKSFHNKYLRDHLTGVTLAREKNLLPQTQELAQHTMSIRNCRFELKEVKDMYLSTTVNLTRMRTDVADKQASFFTLCRDPSTVFENHHGLLSEIIDDMQAIDDMTRRNRDTRVKVDELSVQLMRLERRPAPGRNGHAIVYIAPCPAENCRGFLNSKCVCSLCNTKVCSKCNVVLVDGVDHECNPEDVASTQLIRSETRGCPKCGVRIFRPSGCDHMFCTHCNTGFSWQTGQLIANSANTNPFYYEWLRRNFNSTIRADGDVRCGGIPDATTLLTIPFLFDRMLPFNMCVLRIHRALQHFIHFDMPRFNPVRVPTDHTDLRVSFLMGDISEDEWKRNLRARRKKLDMHTETHQIMDLFVQTMTDLFIMLVAVDSPETANFYLREMWRLKDYVNGEFDRVSHTFDNSTPHIADSSWQREERSNRAAIQSRRVRNVDTRAESAALTSTT
jgi:hypothetical protein